MMNPIPTRSVIGLVMYGLLAFSPAMAQEEGDRPEPRFDVWEFEITGNTSLQPQAVEKAVYP